MKWILITIALLIAISLLIYLIGYLMPVKHTATISHHFSNPPSEIWKTVTSFGEYTTWRKDVKKVEAMDNQNWNELSSHGDNVHYSMEKIEEEKRLVTRIMSKDLPYGGFWTFELKADGNGTQLQITESGEVYNPLFRFMSKYIFGHDGTLKNYIKNLESYLNKK
jgi:Polyketide cyclase / dehydrase and lipid transport